MGMRRKMGRGGADRRRTQSKYEESDASDDDYKIEEDVEYDDSDEYCSSLAEEELENDIVDGAAEKKLRVTRLNRRNGLSTKSRGQVGKACKKRKVSHKEDSDEDYLDDGDDDDGVDEVEVSKDWGIGFPRRKRNRAKKVVKKKEASHMDDQSDGDKDEDYNANEDDLDLWKVFPRRKRNGVPKPVRKTKAAYVEENDDAYKTEDECDDDDDDDYNDNEDEKELRKCCQNKKYNGMQKVLKKKKDLSEEEDDDYEAEDDDCDDDDDYVDNEDEEDLLEDSPTMKENGVQKARKKKKAVYSGESEDDYEVDADEYDDEDDYENEEEQEEVEEEDEDEDEDLASDEIDFDDEDEVVVKKAKKVRHAPSHGRLVSGGRKKRSNSRVISKSKRKTPAKRRTKVSSRCHKEATKEKLKAKETKLRSLGPKRRRLVVDSDSDFADEPLLVEEKYAISEEEREHVSGHQDINLRNSSKKRSRNEANLPLERKHKARKGKDKVEESKNEAAKQVCGVCLSEEGRRTVRGALDCCSHYFCFNCIIDWSKVETRCPLCKQRFSTISKLGRSDITSDSKTTVISVPERDQVYQPSEEELRAYLDPYENVICTECHHGGDDANMLLCDLCDSPAHTYCVGLTEVPEGNWYCEGCRPTVLGPSIPEVARSSPSENVRVAIDLNRAYEPETPLGEGIGMSSSPRPADVDLRAGSSTLGVGVQTVSERRRMHQMNHFTTILGANVALGPEVEWGRTRRFVFPNVTRPATSAFDPTFSQGLLRTGENVGLGLDTSRFHTAFSRGVLGNFASPASNMHLLPVAPSNSGTRRVWGQTFTVVGSSANGNGLLPAGIAGIRSGDAWSNYGHSRMQ